MARSQCLHAGLILLLALPLSEAARPAEGPTQAAALQPGGAFILEHQKENPAVTTGALIAEPAALLQAAPSSKVTSAANQTDPEDFDDEWQDSDEDSAALAEKAQQEKKPNIPDDKLDHDTPSEIGAEVAGTLPGPVPPSMPAGAQLRSDDVGEDSAQVTTNENDDESSYDFDKRDKRDPDADGEELSRGRHIEDGDVPRPVDIERRELFKATEAKSKDLQQAAASIDTTINKVNKAVDKVDGAMGDYHSSINGLTVNFGDLNKMAQDMHGEVLSEFQAREKERMCAFENADRMMRGEPVQPCDGSLGLGDYHAPTSVISNDRPM